MTTEPIPALDDLVRMQAIDKRNMLRLINELPEQCETALGVARNFALEAFDTKPSDVFITGIGDSAIAADMAAAVLSEQAEIPIITDHGAGLPKYVGENSLVIVVDYTGKSSVMLRNMREAKHRGARVICLSGSGKLLEQAAKDQISRVAIPPGQPQRTAIGYLLVPIIVTIERLGLVEGEVEKLSHAIKHLKNVREALRSENPSSRNVAKQIAQNLFGKLTLIYGVFGYRTAVARRWRSQINTNSKNLAACGVLHDMATGEISGYELSGSRAKDIAVVLLKDATDKGATAELASAVEDLLEQFNVTVADIRGSTTTERLFYGLFLGDYVSYYMALLNEADPFRTEYVEIIEDKLAGEPEAIVQASPITEDEQAGD